MRKRRGFFLQMLINRGVERLWWITMFHCSEDLSDAPSASISLVHFYLLVSLHIFLPPPPMIYNAFVCGSHWWDRRGSFCALFPPLEIFQVCAPLSRIFVHQVLPRGTFFPRQLLNFFPLCFVAVNFSFRPCPSCFRYCCLLTQNGFCIPLCLGVLYISRPGLVKF